MAFQSETGYSRHSVAWSARYAIWGGDVVISTVSLSSGVRQQENMAATGQESNTRDWG